MAVKLTIFFESPTNSGFTEIHHHESTTIGTQVEEDAQALILERRRLLPGDPLRGVRITGYRLSVDGVWRDSVFASPAVAEPVPNYGDIGDVAWTGWQCLLEAGDLHRRTFVIRGLPDELMGGNERGARIAAEERINRYLRYLIDADVWGLWVPSKTVQERGIGNVSDVIDGLVTITIDNPLLTHGFVPGDTVIVRNCGVRPVINGRRLVATVPTPQSFTFAVRKGTTLDRTNLGGFVRKLEMVFFGYDGYGVARQADRDTGAPFGARRGRRSRVRR